MPKNLWGDLSTLVKVRTPKAILEEQASFLGEATKGALVGFVNQTGSGTFIFTFGVQVPSLNGYVYSMFNVMHDIELYPAKVICSKPLVNSKCEDPEKFEAVVAEILSSHEVKTILSRLISQVT
jgi:hypothetical protein